MGYLERLFVGTMLLTGLLILFFFGLYFDLGDMVAGSFGTTPTLRTGMELDHIREGRRRGYETERPTGAALPPPAPLQGRPRPSSPVDYGRFVHRSPAISPEVLLDREVRRLQRQGFVNEEFIQMRAIYEVDRSLVPIFDRYDQLIASGDTEGAIAELLAAREALDKKNLLGLRDILQYLGQAYVLAGKDGDASANLKELMDLQERILAIEQQAELHQDAAGKEYAAKMQDGFGKIRAALDKVETAPEGNGYADTFSAARQIMDPNGKVTLHPQAVRLIQGQVSQQIDSGALDGEVAEQARKFMRRFEAGDPTAGR